jgi:redox-sensing transcriptional repressor
MFKRIPQETIIRLSYYLRAAHYFSEDQKEFVSSHDLADYLKLSAHQVRKDFSYFGHFGRKGKGYPVKVLIGKLNEILGLDCQWNACIVGFGNLAKALSLYHGFKTQGIFITLAFDVDSTKTNKQFADLKVYPTQAMERMIKKHTIGIGIITVPDNVAQGVAEKLVRGGVKAILNFAPIKLNLPSRIVVKNIDFSCQLAFLTHRLKNLKA